MRFITGASFVMVSWFRTYGTTAKLRAPCECTRKVMLLGTCGYRSLWLWFIMELHWCVIFRGYLPWNDFYVVCQVIKQHLSSLLDQKGIPLSCVVSLPLTLVVTTYTSFLLHPLCKGEILELFSVERQLICSQKWRLDFPCCWNAGVCSFALSFNPCIPEPSQFVSHEEKDEPHDQMDSCPNAWSTVSMSELSTLGLPMVLRGLAQCRK
jgi:hypothetical protein